MEDEFAELRACIYTNEQELARFRTLVVNAVLATDIADKKMAALRKNRWNDAFAAENENKESPVEINVACTDGYRKATIVFEHIIQAADVAHCMQHWQTYQKWNARLFEEQYLACSQGNGNCPVEGWVSKRSSTLTWRKRIKSSTHPHTPISCYRRSLTFAVSGRARLF